MLGTRRSAETNPNSIFAFKPRQVFLAEHNRKMAAAAAAAPTKKKDCKIPTLNPDEKKQLFHQSILCYLHRNGFSKTLKRFLSEAQIQNDTWKASSFDLEDIYCKYIDSCHSEMHTNKEPELVANGHGSSTTDEKMAKKKKKKGSVENESIPIKDQSEASDKVLVESVTSGKVSADSEAKPNEKKRSKSTLTTPVQIEVAISDVTKKPVDDTAEPFKVDDSTKKPKDKKKKSDSISEIKDKGKTKKNKSSSIVTPVEEVEHSDLSSKQEITVDSLVPDPATGVLGEKKIDTKGKKKKKEGLVSLGTADGSDQGHMERTTIESEGLQPSADTTKKEKNSSKKRKRLAPDDNENQNIEVKTTEESKRRKTEGSEEGTHEDLLTKDDVLNRSKEENVQPDGHPNGKLEINGEEKSGPQNSTKKRHNGSAEPKSANAFQRVKADEVVFAHEKLQDNSYWAKDGADVGYGAKAQEILGQVKGRDFRHEKTKKKRGSYRGGQIDLQSHSVKFNYSDED